PSCSHSSSTTWNVTEVAGISASGGIGSVCSTDGVGVGHGV
ncbi:hypothetical protein PF008_g25749, partial [Phytophthora fragariae]